MADHHAVGNDIRIAPSKTRRAVDVLRSAGLRVIRTSVLPRYVPSFPVVVPGGYAFTLLGSGERKLLLVESRRERKLRALWSSVVLHRKS